MSAAFTSFAQVSAPRVREVRVTSRGLRHIILRHSQGEGSDGGRPLVPENREDIGGHGDHLRCNQDQTNCIPARG